MADNAAKTLTLEQAVQAAAILLELNTDPEGLSDLFGASGLNTLVAAQAFELEWLAYVQACLVHALIECAPAAVVVEYLRQTTAMLHSKGYDQAVVADFVDKRFSNYLTALTEKRAQDCPFLLFQALLDLDLRQAPEQPAARQIAAISAAMGLVLAAIMDKLEAYTYSCA